MSWLFDRRNIHSTDEKLRRDAERAAEVRDLKNTASSAKPSFRSKFLREFVINENRRRTRKQLIPYILLVAFFLALLLLPGLLRRPPRYKDTPATAQKPETNAVTKALE